MRGDAVRMWGGLLLSLAAAAGCAGVGGLSGRFGGGGDSARADSSALQPSEADLRLQRIEAAQGRQEALLRRTNADLSARLDEILREMHVLGERVGLLDQRAAAGLDLPGGEALPGAGGRAVPPDDDARLAWLAGRDTTAGAYPTIGEESPAGGAEREADAPASPPPERGANASSAAAQGVSAPGEGQRIYEQAYQDLMQDNFQLALIGFRSYLSQYPAANLSDNAQYWIAEVYYKQRQFTTAVEEFLKVVEDYPGQDKVPAAYYKLGLCFRNLHDEATARRYFELVVGEYPKANEAQLAAERLAER